MSGKARPPRAGACDPVGRLATVPSRHISNGNDEGPRTDIDGRLNYCVCGGGRGRGGRWVERGEREKL